MKSWQHNICLVRTYEDNYLVTGETIDLDLINYKKTEWAYVVDGKGLLKSSIEPSTEFFYSTYLDRCISEGIYSYKLPLLLNDVDDTIVVFCAKEDGSFSME
ncbi:hypothetical protein ACDX66_00895 [Peribacillus frigoritolerans]